MFGHILEQIITWRWSLNFGLDLSPLADLEKWIGPTILFPYSLEFWHGSCCRTLSLWQKFKVGGRIMAISVENLNCKFEFASSYASFQRDPMKGGLVQRQVRADLTMETFTGMHTPGTPPSHRQGEVPTGALPTTP
ncbi:hypothetical protein OUZ56_022193 [Daphnia magna]|uniref:Uncharacterized protein n=1 Tax=Daphnia magna TaxID=35525 RepID=A0ABR0AVN1_9CRUS|nr:hypothetical protein OUZ56_022193 [Daphnia magna]